MHFLPPGIEGGANQTLCLRHSLMVQKDTSDVVEFVLNLACLVSHTTKIVFNLIFMYQSEHRHPVVGLSSFTYVSSLSMLIFQANNI
jgi:hypothetical protein